MKWHNKDINIEHLSRNTYIYLFFTANEFNYATNYLHLYKDTRPTGSRSRTKQQCAKVSILATRFTFHIN